MVMFIGLYNINLESILDLIKKEGNSFILFLIMNLCLIDKYF